jgi:hypothetical protein
MMKKLKRSLNNLYRKQVVMILIRNMMKLQGDLMGMNNLQLQSERKERGEGRKELLIR